MSASSFRKGRGAEFEVVKEEFIGRGVFAEVNGIYEPLDMNMKIDDVREDFEVKRKRECLSFAYKAIDNDAKGVHCRADRREWLTIIPTADYVELLIRAGAVQITPTIGEPIE